MIINWVAAKAQQFLPVQDAGLDELSVNFDFALSAEIMELLYAQNDDCMEAGGRAAQGAVADDGMEAGGGSVIESSDGAVTEASQQVEAAEVAVMSEFALDEHELALA